MARAAELELEVRMGSKANEAPHARALRVLLAAGSADLPVPPWLASAPALRLAVPASAQAPLPAEASGCCGRAVNADPGHLATPGPARAAAAVAQWQSPRRLLEFRLPGVNADPSGLPPAARTGSPPGAEPAPSPCAASARNSLRTAH